ncbi:MAG TPA: pyridoxamine 5'-phosphate oxidase family protein [Gemmatimonadaceae bacterium]
MDKIGQPAHGEIRALGRDEIEQILARNHVGRIAFIVHDSVDIEPINYVYKDGWIYGRTSQGTKIDAIARRARVAFEVDEVKALFDWRSVVVKGSLSVMRPDGAPHSGPSDTSWHPDAAFTVGVELLRSLLPETLKSTDPASFRHTVFRIHLDEVTGREAKSAT